MIFLLLLGTVVLAVMALTAHNMAYFPGDLTISHAVQTYHSDWLDTVLGAVSWLGDVFAGCLLGGLWLAVVIRLYTWGKARLPQRSQQVTLGLPRRLAGASSAPQADTTGQG